MAASVNDKFSKVSTGARPNTTTVASIRAVDGTSLVCDDLTGWDTDTGVHFVTYQVDGQGEIVAGTQLDMKGTVSSNTISAITVTGGTDAGNAVGDIVEQIPTAAWAKDLADGLLVSLDQDGTLKAGAVDNSAVIANDVVDSQHYVAGSIDTEHYAAASVTPAKRSGGFKIGTIAGSTFSTTGNKSITGVGFTPKLVKFYAIPSAAGDNTIMAHGSMDASGSQFVTATASSTTAGNIKRNSSTSACVGYVPSTSSTFALLASYVSMDADGFTVNVTTANGDLGFVYEAYA